MFNGTHDISVKQDGKVFLDRDGETFLSLINYLRNNREVFPKFVSKDEEQMFTKELEFWDMKEDLAKLIRGETGMEQDEMNLAQAEKAESVIVDGAIPDPCDAVASGNPDNDGDGVSDSCDLGIHSPSGNLYYMVDKVDMIIHFVILYFYFLFHHLIYLFHFGNGYRMLLKLK